MVEVTFLKLILNAVVVLQIIQRGHAVVTLSRTCPESCVCTPEGTIYCDARNKVSIAPTIPSYDDKFYVQSQNEASIYGEDLLDKSKDHLMNNQLRTIFKDVLQRMPTLKIIDLSDNKLNCDCETLWLQKWLKNTQMKKQFPNNIDYRCASPPSLKGQRVIDISSSDLGCPLERLKRQRRKTGQKAVQPTYTSRPLDFCAENHCGNNGSCVLRDGHSLCMCPLSFNGDTCQTRSEPQLQIYAKQLLDKTVQVNWTLDREPLDIKFNLQLKNTDGGRLIQSLMLPGQMRHVTIEGPFMATRVSVCIHINEHNLKTNVTSCKNISIDERGHGLPPSDLLPPPSDLPDNKIYNPYDASNFNEVIDKASIALGSIIGLCGLLILGLAIAYKNRQIDSDNNANMTADMNGLSSAYISNTIIQLQTIRESYEEEGQEATLADASQVPIVETTGESLNMNNNADSMGTVFQGTRRQRNDESYDSSDESTHGLSSRENRTVGLEPTLRQSQASETGTISIISA